MGELSGFKLQTAGKQKGGKGGERKRKAAGGAKRRGGVSNEDCWSIRGRSLDHHRRGRGAVERNAG